MVLETLSLIVMSVIAARLLEKRYKVASIAHAIFFILVASYYLYVTDYTPLVNMWLTYIDEKSYYVLKEALKGSSFYFNHSISTIVCVELIVLIFIPFISIAAFVKLIREECKEISVNHAFKIDRFYIDNKESSSKEFVPSDNNLYLKYQVLLN